VVEVLGFDDGRRVTGARIPWARNDPERGQFNDLTASGDHLLVNRNRQGNADLSVYRLDTMTELWNLDSHQYGYAFPCGPGICVSNDGGLASYDPDTGRARWHLPGIANGWSPSDSRVVVAEPENDGRQFLVDSETGRRVGGYGTGETVWTTDSPDALLVLKETASPPDRTSVTRWDLATGRRDLLGSVDRIIVNRCQAVAHYLGCYERNTYAITAVGR
jgi:hypothetical protein